PEAGNIVVDFLHRRNFDKVNGAFAPVPYWLRPQTRALFEFGFEILVCPIVLLPLHQTKTARIDIGKQADLEVLRIAERTPKFLATPIVDRHAIGIMYRRPEVIHVSA